MIFERKPPPFSAKLVVVGGQASKVGKTALVVDILRAFPNQEWTAVKISLPSDGNFSNEDHSAVRDGRDPAFSIQVEKELSGLTDTSRFLVAGAKKAIWMQASGNQFAAGLSALTQEIGDAKNVIIESTRIAKYWKPDIFIIVLDPRRKDVKESIVDLAALADVFLCRSNLSEKQLREFAGHSVPMCSFLQPLGKSLPDELRKIVGIKIAP